MYVLGRRSSEVGDGVVFGGIVWGWGGGEFLGSMDGSERERFCVLLI